MASLITWVDVHLPVYRAACLLGSRRASFVSGGTLLRNARRDPDAAEAAYREALRLSPGLGLARHNLGNLLRDEGYQTGICGKWQLGRVAELPEQFGFDEHVLWQHTRFAPRYPNPGLEHQSKQVDYADGEYGPDLISDFALDFVERHKDAPFLLYYPMILPHFPHQATPDSDGWDPTIKGENKNKDDRYFADMVRYMDQLVGRLVDALDEL